MKTFLIIPFLVLLALPSIQAADPAPAPAAPPPPAIKLGNKSAFTMEASGRNPFWPIGWKPATKIATTQRSTADIQSSTFLVSSIAFDEGGRYAIINGKTMQAGQQFGLQLGSQTYQITVKAIEDGRVILMRRDEEIIVPLRRK